MPQPPITVHRIPKFEGWLYKHPFCTRTLHLPFHTGIRLPEKELVEFKGRRLVSVEPHCVACRLPQLVPYRGGHQRDGEAIHLLTGHSAEESGFINVWHRYSKTRDW